MALTAETTDTLEAINTMLAMVSERSITLLPSVDSATAAILPANQAEIILHRVSREVQSEGWGCNTERAVEITADGSGFINIPTDVIKIDATDTTKRYTPRGLKMFNAERGENTFVFTVGEIMEVNLVRMLAFEDLPETLRRYMAVKAGRVLIQNLLRDQQLYDSFGKRELDALIAAQNAEWQDGETSMFENFDSMTIIDREIRSGSAGLRAGFID